MKLTKYAKLLAVLLLSGCTIAKPFSAPKGTPAPTAPVTVVVTYALLDNEQRQPFDDYTERLADSLDAGQYPGLVGYSIRKEILGDEVWSLTAWTDLNAMVNFARSGLHAEAKSRASHAIRELQVRHFELEPSALPPSWELALGYLDAPATTTR
jgi:heme-degrading monooxygenase HmoA